VTDSRVIRLDAVEDAIAAMRDGRPIVVVDDEDRENEGDLILAASAASADRVGFMIRHTSGYICVGMTGDVLDRLDLPPMTAVNEDARGTAYAVSVDARDVESTGISAADRARTIKVLADSATEPWELTRPGHVMPLRAVPGGVLRRAGHTEAAVDLATLAGMSPAGALCELVNDDGTMMRAPECRAFADEHGLVMISIADLIRYRRRTEHLVAKVAEKAMPTLYGDFTAIGFRSEMDHSEHIALVTGEIGDGEDVLVRVHSECLTGDVFGSYRCDCGPQLHAVRLGS
jgi:3,4-dihydroxy 2-butanone 4-phosphate synthase/GTP cyclohydrolase II